MEFSGKSFFREEVYKTSDFSELETSSGVKTLNRDPSRGSAALFYGLSKGYSLEDMHGMSQEQRYQLGDEFVRFLRANPTGENLPKSTVDRSMRNIARMFSGGMEQLLKEKWPDYDPADPASLDRPCAQGSTYTVQNRLEMLQQLGIDYVQLLENKRFDENPVFTDSMGGEEHASSLNESAFIMTNAAGLVGAAQEPLSREPAERAAQAGLRWGVEHFADRYRAMRGEPLEKLNREMVHGDENFELYAALQLMARITCPVMETERINSYLQGEGGLFGSRAEERSFLRDMQNRADRALEGDTERAKVPRDVRERERRLNNWVERVEERQAAEGYGGRSTARMYENGSLSANRVNSYGEEAAEMLGAQRGMEAEYPFVNDWNKPFAAFLISMSDRMNQEQIQERARLSSLNEIRTHLEQNDREARRAIPDEAERSQLMERVSADMDRARLSLESEQERTMRLRVVNACFDRLCGKEDASHTWEMFDALAPEMQASIRERVNDQLRSYAPPELQGFTFDSLRQIRPLPSAQPDRLTLHFENTPQIDISSFRSHVARPNRLTQLEKDYAASTFDQTFDRMYEEDQRRMLNCCGRDMFDMIRIDGKSVRERFGKKYEALPEEEQAAMFRCEVAAAALDPKKQITASRVYETPEHGLAVQTAAVGRICDLPEPRHTLGQRFLDKLGIRKIVPFKEQLAQANLPETLESAREAAKMDPPVSQTELAVGAQRNNWQTESKHMGLYKPDTMEKFFQIKLKDLAKHDQMATANTLVGTSTLSRPGPMEALLLGQMLNQGYSMRDCFDNTKLVEQKTQMAQAVVARLQDPKEAGKLMAESFQAMMDLDIRKEISTVLGRPVKDSEELESVLSGGPEMGLTLPYMNRLKSMTREMVQTVNAVKSPGALMFYTQDERAIRGMLQLDPPLAPEVEEQKLECMKAFLEGMGEDGVQKFENSHWFGFLEDQGSVRKNMGGLLRDGKLMEGVDKRDFAYNLCLLRRANHEVAQAGTLGNTNTWHYDLTITGATNSNVLNGLTDEQLDDYIYNGKASEYAEQIEKAVIPETLEKNLAAQKGITVEALADHVSGKKDILGGVQDNAQNNVQNNAQDNVQNNVQKKDDVFTQDIRKVLGDERDRYLRCQEILKNRGLQRQETRQNADVQQGPQPEVRETQTEEKNGTRRPLSFDELLEKGRRHAKDDSSVKRNRNNMVPKEERRHAKDDSSLKRSNEMKQAPGRLQRGPGK